MQQSQRKTARKTPSRLKIVVERGKVQPIIGLLKGKHVNVGLTKPNEVSFQIDGNKFSVSQKYCVPDITSAVPPEPV